MFLYPLGGLAHVYINNHDLSEFCAKLVTNYSILGYEVTSSYNQGTNRSSFTLFHQAYGLLTLTLPLEFSANGKAQTMEHIAKFNAECRGQVEIDLSDGFSYTCMLSEVTETEWLNDEHCTLDYSFIGFKHKEAVAFSAPAPLKLYNNGTWPRNDCIITVRSFAVTSSTPVVLSVSDGSETYLSWAIDTSGGLYAGGDLVLDGVNKRNLYNGGNIPTGTMTWTDYPYLKPGKNTISLSGGLTSAELAVEYTPAYL